MYDQYGNPVQFVQGVDVLGGEMQTTGGMSVIGYEDDGTPIVVGKAPAKRGRALVQVQAPQWRNRQLAPGVIATDEGLVPLPMHGVAGSDTFVTAAQRIIFQGQIQKPFHGERLLVSVVRTGATAVGRLLGQAFVGTDLQQADIDSFDLEQVGQPGAFGVRLHMKPAQPGVLIRIITTLSTALTGTDTIFVSMSLLGKILH